MNKVFKVVWNEVRAAYMVCDENSMTRGKPKSVKTAVLAASVAAMMGLSGMTMAEPLASERTQISYDGNQLLTQAAQGDNLQYSLQNGTITVSATGQADNFYGVVSNLYKETSGLEYISKSGVNVANSRFEGNSSTNAGGAMTLWNDGNPGTVANQHLVSDTEFTGNTAVNQGGALSLMNQNAFDVQGGATLNNVSFSGNSAAKGGAVYSEQYDLSIEGNSSFVGNTAQNGGAIYNDKGDLNVGEGAVFKDNVSTAQNYGGGAIYNNGGDVTIGNGVQFVGNKLDQPVSVSSDRDMRSAGGAIASWNGGSLNIGENVVFENNGYNTSGDVAWSGGGAIYLDTDTKNVAEMTIGSGTRFSGNVAGSLGGAIYAGDSRTEITGATFDNNKAGSWGGAIFAGQYYALEGHGVTISGSQFNGNEAGNYGGAIASQYTTLNVADTTFSGNKAGLIGGAIIVQGDADDASYAGSATIENSSFNGNSAGQVGGAIYVQNAALSISGTTFDGNTVAVDGKGNSGGALYINNSGETVATVKDSTFTNNTAGYTADVNSPSDIV